MRQIVRMPLGFFDINTSGRIRKIIDDNAGVTHSFLAHQLPDLAATFLVPLVAAILIFVFDWILGLACIVPVIIAMLVMGFMMNAEGRQFMKSYMTSLEEMNTGACRVCERNSRSEGFPADYLLFQKTFTAVS